MVCSSKQANPVGAGQLSQLKADVFSLGSNSFYEHRSPYLHCQYGKTPSSAKAIMIWCGMEGDTRFQNFTQTSDGLQRFSLHETVPFRVISMLGKGGQAIVEEVEHETQGWRCVRKRWKVYRRSDLEKATERFLHEITILSKLRSQPHVITMLATYTQGLDFALLHLPRAVCDLDQLLHEDTRRRRELISDNALKKGFGCLCVALQFIHKSRVRHDDIKPQNILLHEERLIFTDFGVSRDFSDLTSSITEGYFRGTRNYSAPEVATGKRRGCAADVFSLGCVLLEIWSVLVDASCSNQESAGEKLGMRRDIRSLKPYRDNLTGLDSWIEAQMESVAINSVESFWLETCRLMLSKSPTERPRMSNISLVLRERFEQQAEILSSTICHVCLENHVFNLTEDELDELKNVDFVWGTNIQTSPNGNASEVIMPNSNRGVWNVWMSRLLLSPLRTAGLLERWHLTVYLDNGRPLRAYGTQPACVNYAFDFGESLIDRVVFQGGTFGNVVELYRRPNWEHGPCFRKGSPCDERFDEPKSIRSYKVVWE